MFEIQDFFHFSFRTLSLAGVKLANDPRTILARMYCVSSVLNICGALVFAFSVPVYKGFADDLQMTSWLLYKCFGINCFCKVFSVLWVRRDLQELVQNLQNAFPRTVKDKLDFNVEEYFYKLKWNLHLLHDLHWCVAFMFVLFPITQSLVEWFFGWGEVPTFIYRLPYIMVFPFNTQQFWGYMGAYLIQLAAGLTVSCYFLGADMLLITTVHLLNMQFEHLSKNIERFQPKRQDSDMQELISILKRHSMLLEYSEVINHAFSISNLLNYMLSVVIICLIGFQVVAGSGFFDLLKFGGFLFASLSDVYLICRFGTCLIMTSERVSEALSCHKWYEAGVRYQRMLPLAIARAQRPAHLRAYRFFIITNESFKTVVTTSYQFFTLIKTRYDEANQSL